MSKIISFDREAKEKLQAGIDKVNKAVYPLLSDSLQSKGGGFTNPPNASAPSIDPGMRKLQLANVIPTYPSVPTTRVIINLSINFRFFIYPSPSLSQIRIL